jgi:hypothetical protein
VNRNVTPLTAGLIVLGILVVLGGVYLFHNNRSSQDAQQAAKRGEASGQKMMQAISGRPPNGP